MSRPEVLRTKTNDESEDTGAAATRAAATASINVDASTSRLAPLDLNFECGMSAHVLETIVIQQDHKKARERHLKKQKVAEAANSAIVRTSKLTISH